MPLDADPERLTLTVAQYARIAGVGEHSVREDIRLGRVPHVRAGKRGLIRILRIPALARLGATESPD